MDRSPPTPWPFISITNSKLGRYGPTNALSHHAKQLLSWRVDWSIKKDELRRLWRNLSWFHTKVARTPEWEDLPPELWGEIGSRLASRVDIICFRSVCEQWRASLPSPILFPLRVPPLPLSSHSPFITELGVYLSKEKVMTYGFEEVEQGGGFKGLSFQIQISRSTISPTYLYHSRYYMAGKAYHLRRDKKKVQGQWVVSRDEHAQRLVIISSSGDVNPSCARASDLCVVAHLAQEPMEGRLALLRLCGAPESWVWDTDFCGQVFDAIATYRGRLCALDRLGRLFLMESESLKMTQVCLMWPEVPKMMDPKYLFEYSGDLHLATFNHKEESLVLYRLCLPLQNWTKLHTPRQFNARGWSGYIDILAYHFETLMPQISALMPLLL